MKIFWNFDKILYRKVQKVSYEHWKITYLAMYFTTLISILIFLFHNKSSQLKLVNPNFWGQVKGSKTDFEKSY